MLETLQELLSLDPGNAQKAWIQQYTPNKDVRLVNALREESYRRERGNPHAVLLVAAVLAGAASVWEDQETLAVAILVEANADRLLGQHQLAIDLYDKAIAIFQVLRAEAEEIRACVGKIDSLMNVGRYDEALIDAEKAIQYFHTANDATSLARTLVNKGNIFARLSRYHLALDCYAEAHAIFARQDINLWLAMVEANQANVYLNLDEFRRAEDLYERSQAHFEGEGMASAAAQVEHNLACLYAAKGEYQRALMAFSHAREIFVAQDSPYDAAYADLYRSDVYLALNLWQESLHLVHIVRPVFEKAGMQWEIAKLRLNEGIALAHMDDFTAASRALLRARKMFVREKNSIWTAMTDLYLASFALRGGECAAARKPARRAGQVFSSQACLAGQRNAKSSSATRP